MFNLPPKIVVFDLESTTWEGALERNWSGEGEHREVVQCGAVIVETENFTEQKSFDRYVKPKVNPTLSDYFVDLTHITQEEVDKNGIDFETFLNEFHKWCGDLELYCFSGTDRSSLLDVDILKDNCKLLGIKLPFEEKRFHNVNLIFHEHGYEVKQSGSAPEAFGIELPARPHNAINDVRGLVVGLKELSKRVSG